VQRRNDDEFAAFVAVSHERLRRTAYLICGDWHRASDITQEALIRVYVAWPRLDKRGGLLAYARRAVVNVSIDQSRKLSSTEVPAASDERARCRLASVPASSCATSRTCRSPRWPTTCA
jgi:DNA-directed RNA polymerase specialized sigma24 family protein